MRNLLPSLASFLPDPMQAFFWIAWLVVVLIALLPLVFFLAFGWPARRDEFLARVRSAKRTMQAYYRLFWPEIENYLLQSKKDLKIAADKRDLSGDERESLEILLFEKRYNTLVGRSRYAVPALLFIAVVALLSGLVVVTALRTGNDTYIGYLEGTAAADIAAAAATHGLTVANPIEIHRLTIAALEADVLPFPPLHLSLTALAAIAGAYLFVVAQLIQQARARTLVYSDLYTYSLRLAIAIPLGLSVASLASPAVGSLVAFGLGAFPIAGLRSLMRRLVAVQIKDGTTDAEADQTLNMVGVTRPVSDVLADENITNAQQIAGIDPVVLAVRTGLSFEYVLNLAAQSIVWSYLGPTTLKLAPLGLFDARAIAWLMRHESETNRQKVFDLLQTQTALGPAIEHAFRRICDNAYTQFLVEFEPKPKPPAST